MMSRLKLHTSDMVSRLKLHISDMVADFTYCLFGLYNVIYINKIICDVNSTNEFKTLISFPHFQHADQINCHVIVLRIKG